MKKNYKRILAEDMVARFRKEFYAMFGVFPLVSYSFHGNPLPKITLTMLENLVNDVMESDHPEYYTPQGIRLRSRKRTVVIYRQIFLTIAKEIGYGSTVSAEHIDYDHATAIHAVKMINNLLDSKDDQVLRIYKSIIDVYKKRFGNDGDVQQDDSGKPDAERVLPPLLDERVDSGDEH